MDLDMTTWEHPCRQGTAGFERPLFRVRPEIYLPGVRTTRRTQQLGSRQVRPVVGAKELHQHLAVRREIPGRNAPIRPCLCRILVELFLGPGRGTNSVPGQDHQEFQLRRGRLSFLRGRGSRQEQDRDDRCPPY